MPYIHIIGIDKILISNILFKAIKFLCVFESTNKLFEKKLKFIFGFLTK